MHAIRMYIDGKQVNGILRENSFCLKFICAWFRLFSKTKQKQKRKDVNYCKHMLRALIAIGQQKNSVYPTTASWKVVASKSKLKRFPMKGRFVNRGPGGIPLNW